MFLKSNTKTIQTLELKKISKFLLLNTSVDYSFVITKKARDKISMEFWKKSKLSKKEAKFINELIESKYLVEEVEHPCKTYIFDYCEFRYPLTSFSLELTNTCNLSCIHCYRSFSHPTQRYFIPFEWIKNSLDDLERLHTKSISLTGGECTLHPDFLEILVFYLSKGFEVTVFTNGFNTELISKVLFLTKEFRYSIKVSLDGFEETHNIIRGNNNSFKRVISTLNKIAEYDNILLYISTTIMKDNIFQVCEFKDYIKDNFPTAIHTHDVVFPMGDGNNCSFSVQELTSVRESLPFVLEDRGYAKQKQSRCSAAISQCCIMADGRLKICNAANDDIFYFKHNAFDAGLLKAWSDVGENILHYREEKSKSTIDCLRCKYRKKCYRTDCRVQAKAYYDDEKRSNPITCFEIKEKVEF